ncbi:SulP family inorganic anion transporter [Microbacterium esteraromaticum]|uniref:SulP family inorganic anion transporter n=1 Tax=Microbacterium esteraromaticum TaxID=57043 RepID=UPI0023676266|nr:SulP family inorganic anion transporter [Microbacterium esteraromaticum]WDH80336.1 SulP family inorganic anion transporter [Microbacterium esteraromaticum]
MLAGVTLLAIAIPLNIGYAQIAGLPATAGLYALVVPTIVYALVVSSRQLVASPDAAAAALVASSIGGLAAPQRAPRTTWRWRWHRRSSAASCSCCSQCSSWGSSRTSCRSRS